MMPTEDEVVVTGVGLVSCLGSSVPETWAAIRAGRCGLGLTPALECPSESTKGGGQAADPPPSVLPGRSREARLLRMAIEEALEGASGLAPAPGRIGMVLGTTLHGMRLAGEYLRGGATRLLSGFLAGATLRRSLEGLHVFGGPFEGPAITTCAACSSGLSSVGLALTLLRRGELDMVVAGGYDPISEYAYAGFDSLRVVSATRLRPFCKGRDGMKLAEGYGVLVLERAGSAAGRGAIALGAIRGYGEAADAHHLTLPHPEGDGAARAIVQALARADVRPAGIGLIAAHATATPNNDAAERAAFRTVFGAAIGAVPVVAFKSHLGHTLGGAGAVELILSLMAMRDGIVPPTAGVDAVEFPEISLVEGVERRAAIEYTLNTSLGFGGANTCIVAGRPGRSGARLPTRHEVAITGIGVVLPGTIGLDALGRRVGAGRTDLDAAAPGSIAEAEFAHLVSSRRVRRMSDYVRLTLAATSLAMEDAGVHGDSAFAESCSVILGTMHGSATFSEEYYAQIVRDGPGAANPVLFAEGVPNAASAQLSLMLGIKGGCQSIIGSRTAGVDALRLAALRVAAGEWDRAIVGAGEEASPIVTRAYTECGLRASGMATTGSPGGFVSSAGAVTFILERRDHAEARGKPPRGLVLDGAGATARWDLEAGAGVVTAVRQVLDQLERDGGESAPVLGSANATWIDRAESLGAFRAGRRLTNFYGLVPEVFSASPLISAAAAIAGLWPPPRPEAGPSFDVLATDFAGAVAGVRVRTLV